MSSHELYQPPETQDHEPYKPVRLVFIIAWLAAFAGALWTLGHLSGVN